MNEQNTGYAMGWDTPIANDGQDFVLLPAGEYDFEVSKFEREHFDGSAKIPPCNKAVLSLRVDDGQGAIATVTSNLLLYSTLEWKISQFFRSIGQKQHGQSVVPNWQMVAGARGRCKIGVRKYTTKNGEERESNEVLEFLDPPTNGAQAPQQPPAQYPPQQQTMAGYSPQGGWQSGKF